MDIEFLSYHEMSDYNISVNEYFFFIACEIGHKEWLEWARSFDSSLTIEMKENMPFQLACESGNVEILEYIYNNNNQMIFYDVDFLYSAFMSCHYEVAKFIHNKYPELYDRMDPLDLFEIFSLWCTKNKPMAMWFFDTISYIPTYLYNHKLFVAICDNNDLILAQFLVERRPNNYFIQVIDNNIVHYEVTNYLNIFKTIRQSRINLEMCCICYECANVYTSCSHTYCLTCLTKHYEKNGNKCPYCRKENEEKDLYSIV